MQFALAAALFVTSLVAGRDATASEPSPYCDRVRAIADSTSALLYSPRLELQGVRFPQNGAVDTAALVGDDFQARAALSYSPLDAYKGVRVERVASADCAQHEASRRVEDHLLISASVGRLAALRRTAAYLESRRSDWSSIEERATRGLAAQVVSLLELDQIRRSVSDLERSRETVDGEIARIEALRAPESSGADMSSMLRSAESAALAFERRASELRELDAFEFEISAGAAPDRSSTEFFGVARISMSFGVIAQRAAERRALEARARELRGSRSELRDRARAFRDHVAANAREVQRSAEIVARRLDSLRSARAALDGAQTPRAPLARDILDLDAISVEAEKILLDAWLSELRRAGDIDVDS